MCTNVVVFLILSEKYTRYDYDLYVLALIGCFFSSFFSILDFLIANTRYVIALLPNKRMRENPSNTQSPALIETYERLTSCGISRIMCIYMIRVYSSAKLSTVYLRPEAEQTFIKRMFLGNMLLCFLVKGQRRRTEYDVTLGKKVTKCVQTFVGFATLVTSGSRKSKINLFRVF